ncbi:hypothetical protein VIAG107301_08050 [Vibrio agarivorans]
MTFETDRQLGTYSFPKNKAHSFEWAIETTANLSKSRKAQS